MKKFKLTAWILVIVMLLSLFVSQGMAVWYFVVDSATANTAVQTRADILNYNTEDADSITTDVAKKYDVYFLAQNIDINKFVRYSNAINSCEFKAGVGYSDLYYTNPEQGVNGYMPKLGSWDPNFSTDNTNLDNLFVKFTDKYYLSEEDIEMVREPYSKMCDGNSRDNAIFKLDFLDWTLDNIYIDYATVYDTDNDLNYPIYENGEKVVVFPEVKNATIYNRSAAYGEKGPWGTDKYLQVYGTYPTSGFNIANLNTLLSEYDGYSYRLNGKDCLFFYPIYSVGKDQLKSNRRLNSGNQIKNAHLLFEDCIRSEDSNETLTDNYVTFDCHYTSLLQNYKDSSNKSILKDQIKYWTITSGPNAGELQGWEEYTTQYKCFKFSNRLVTEEMVEKNALAEANADPDATFDTTTMNRRYPLTAQQVDQISKGEYVFVDIAQHRFSYDGYKFSYLQEENGDLLNINYKPGMFNVYVFVKQGFADGIINATENLANNRYSLDRFKFSQAEIDGIDQIMREQNVNIDKSVSCKMYDGFIENTGGWNRHDGRDYYVVFEEKITPYNVSSYGSTPTNDEVNYEYAMQVIHTAGNCFVTNAGIDYDVDNVVGTISTENALKDLSDNPITLTYPNYYFTNVIKSEESVIFKQNIGRGLGQVYLTPKFNYIFENGTRIGKEYQSTQLLETMYSAVMNSETERQRITVTINAQTKTLADLAVDETMTDLYASILQQLENVQLIKVKISGNYRICVYTYKNSDDERCFDVWASSPDGFIVSVYDNQDFSNADITKDVNGLLISRDIMIENYSFICNVNFYEDADLMYGNDIEAQEQVTFKMKHDKDITEDLSNFLSLIQGEHYITLLGLLEYYDGLDKCICDIATGRYVTMTNIQTLPFVINEDHLFVVVDKPVDMT